MGVGVLENRKTGLVPESGIIAGCIVRISEVEIKVVPVACPFYLVFGRAEGNCNVLELFEA